MLAANGSTVAFSNRIPIGLYMTDLFRHARLKRIGVGAETKPEFVDCTETAGPNNAAHELVSPVVDGYADLQEDVLGYLTIAKETQPTAGRIQVVRCSLGSLAVAEANRQSIGVPYEFPIAAFGREGIPLGIG